MGKLCVILFLACLVGVSHGWRSLTHQNFGLNLASEIPLVSDSQSFSLGCSSPDAFRPPFLFSSLHDFKFAGYQLLFALDSVNGTNNFEFDPVSYSLGFGCHLAQDLIAHHKHGFVRGGTIYEPILELGVDSFVYWNETKKILNFPKDSKTFISDATKDFSEHGGSKGVSSCVIRFDEVMFNEMCNLETGVLLPHDSGYKKRIVKYDPYGSSSFEETTQHLELAFECSRLTSLKWVDAILSTRSPETAEAETKAYADSLFSIPGKCWPKGDDGVDKVVDSFGCAE